MQALPRPLKWPPIFPLEKGLVLWLPFDDRSEAGAMDRSGKANHGTLYGPTWVAGHRGSALSFPGVNEYVRVETSSSLVPMSAITVGAWIKWAGGDIPTGGRRTIVSKYSTTLNKGWILDIVDDSNVEGLRFWVLGTSSKWITSPPTVWTHVVGTWDGQYVQLYVNGGLKKTSVKAGTITDTAYVGIGRRHLTTEYFNGIIDEVRIYNRALNAAEIKRLHESELLQGRF